jgi:2-polyprenyl-3-methyl-5-hydroxy-6-metoxy-1,4-benzoquinol methylase
MPFGSILSNAKDMTLETADNKNLKVTKISSIGLKVLGIPHIGVRERASLILNSISKLNIKKEEKILDAGCGIGMYSLTLVKKGFNIIGIDIEKSKINQAKEIAKRARLNKNNLRLEQGDLTKTKASMKKKFGLAICSDVLEHISKDKQTIKNISYYLKNYGKLILTVPRITKYSENIKKYKRFGHVRKGYSERQILRILNENDLKVIEIKTSSSAISRWAFKINERLYSSPFLLGLLFCPLFLISKLSFLTSREKDDGFFIIAEKR